MVLTADIGPFMGHQGGIKKARPAWLIEVPNGRLGKRPNHVFLIVFDVFRGPKPRGGARMHGRTDGRRLPTPPLNAHRKNIRRSGQAPSLRL